MPVGGNVRGPHFFQPVEVADFRPENMHDDVAAIDQNPVALLHALDAGGAMTGFFYPARQMVGDRPNMALGAPVGDDHKIRDGGFVFKIDDNDVFGLIVFKTRFCQLKKGCRLFCVQRGPAGLAALLSVFLIGRLDANLALMWDRCWSVQEYVPFRSVRGLVSCA